MNRRNFIQATAMASVAALLPKTLWAQNGAVGYLPPLQTGDTIALATPLQSISFSTLNGIKNAYQTAGFKFLDATQTGNPYNIYQDKAIADNLNRLFKDPEIKGIALLPGMGLARLLPYLDFQALWQNPKIILGTGQSTILHFAAYTQIQMGSCFVSPTAILNSQNLEVVKNGAKTVHYPPRLFEQISNGFASGTLLGGNLSALVELIGTPYFPNLENKILIVEDSEEETYRIDRLLTQLRLSGNLHKLSGFIFSACTSCAAFNSAGTMRLNRILYDHFASIGIPVIYGQVMDKNGNQLFSLGVKHEFDADSGLLTQLQSTVKSADNFYRPE